MKGAHWKYPLTPQEVNPLDQVKKIYVALEGPSAKPETERLKASIVAWTNGRFRIVETPEEADATLQGWANVVWAGETQITGAEASSAFTRKGPVADEVSGSVTRKTVNEDLILRLVVHPGSNVWAWDNTAWCAEPVRAKCAVLALYGASRK
jgi:hypothetical protein